MLGDCLLVAPVFHDRRSEYYLPEGEWVHLLTGELRHGNRWFSDKLDFFGMPLWIRQNRLLPLGPELAQVSYDFAADVRLVCGKLDERTSCEVEIVDGRGQASTGFSHEQTGRRVTIKNHDGRRDFEIQVPWLRDATELEGAKRIEPPHAGERIPGEPGGLLLRATAERVSFVW
jgi:alpha-D-xyloside xylohydrolase